ncbi:urea amidolyase family protein [Moellerella wisconsensis]|uniref:5-oxoprolinase subunit B/C family protein n=1 Tax=Moellerella wisconsensis TaxID=158849 RepID=UPI00240EF9B8|nr:urea amidolyase family protein [Moellerella wisconsensis]
MRFLPINDRALLVELTNLEHTLALFAALNTQSIAGIEQIIPAAKTLLVHYSPWITTPTRLARQISRCDLSEKLLKQGKHLAIPVHYCGEDLSDVAEYLGMTTAQLITRHTESLYQVAFTGFAPGFAYMIAPDAQINVPRRKTPRTRIPAGSVALAGEFSGIYPQASPGGWQLIGKTDMAMWDIDRAEPALLKPGYQVSFYNADQAPPTISLPTIDSTENSRVLSATPASQNTAMTDKETPSSIVGLTLLSVGLQTLYQDAGRAGQAALGISASGAMDKQALHSANRAVGNPPDTVCLEITQGGFRAQAECDMLIAITGATGAIELITADQQVHALPSYQPVHLACGDQLILGQLTSGVRRYLAVRGGFAVSPILGSCSYDSLANVGPAPLKVGEQIAINSRVWSLSQHSSPLSAVSLTEMPAFRYPTSEEITVLDIYLGPRTDWFTAQALERLLQQSWQVTPASNRIGLRLSAEHGLSRSQTQELPSEGTCLGAIQVPADGQPVLFLHDHPLTGGYPVIATVAEYHIDLAGQIPINGRIRFNPISQFNEINKGSANDE